jgi:hypothetical protein
MKTPEEKWPCSWEENEREHLRHNMTLTFRQKMQWLEDTTAFVRKLQAGRTLTAREAEAEYKVRTTGKTSP